MLYVPSTSMSVSVDSSCAVVGSLLLLSVLLLCLWPITLKAFGADLRLMRCRVYMWRCQQVPVAMPARESKLLRRLLVCT
jgi:hypothetical protein